MNGLGVLLSTPLVYHATDEIVETSAGRRQVFKDQFGNKYFKSIRDGKEHFKPAHLEQISPQQQVIVHPDVQQVVQSNRIDIGNIVQRLIPEVMQRVVALEAQLNQKIDALEDQLSKLNDVGNRAWSKVERDEKLLDTLKFESDQTTQGLQNLQKQSRDFVQHNEEKNQQIRNDLQKFTKQILEDIASLQEQLQKAQEQQIALQQRQTATEERQTALQQKQDTTPAPAPAPPPPTVHVTLHNRPGKSKKAGKKRG